jgi:hypothetical protein
MIFFNSKSNFNVIFTNKLVPKTPAPLKQIKVEKFTVSFLIIEKKCKETKNFSTSFFNSRLFFVLEKTPL